ncbi:MAG TPA: M28 family peptidase [Anaerolineaceae bacterium]|nr:M28 family peptidase [Anaerolineaceae bacterium]
MKNGIVRFVAFCLVLLMAGGFAMVFWGRPAVEEGFNGDRAYRDVLYQTSLGARTPGSTAHESTVLYISRELQNAGWRVEIQRVKKMGKTVTNLIARRSNDPVQIILGAHYDSRMTADRELELSLRDLPVPGANDGASGTAVLLELARTLPQDINKEIWLVFFDLEDQGQINNWDWIIGSRAFVEQLETTPASVVIIDMIGDSDLNIYREKNSDPELTSEIWNLAEELGYGHVFLDQPKYSILDDHTPFLEKGIRAVDIIDFDYPYWHTLSDTADKVSSRSLEIVGNVLLAWLTQ